MRSILMTGTSFALHQAPGESGVSISAANPLAALETMVAIGDTELSEFIGALIQKDNEVKAGPVATLLTIRELYCDPNDDNPTGLDLMEAGFPRPVAKPEYEEGVNGPHEFFEAPKMGKDGALKMTKCNFFTEFWADTKLGKAQDFQLAQLKMLGTNDEGKAEQFFRDIPVEKRENMKKKIQNDKSKGRSIIRDAIACGYVMEDMADYKDRVSLELDEDKDGYMSGSRYPFNLVDNTRRNMYRPMTVGDVKKLDVAMAVADAGEKGNLYQALVDQLTRDTGTPTGEAATFVNIDAMLLAVRQFNNYLDIASEDGKEHCTLLNSLFARKNADNLILEYGEFVSAIKATWNAALETRYRRIVEKQIETGALDEAPAKTGTNG